jgi:hypothetical protein
VIPPRGGITPPPPAVRAPSGAAESGRVAALVAEANAHYARAQAALRAGDFAAYGNEIDALGRTLAELRRVTETQ